MGIHRSSWGHIKLVSVEHEKVMAKSHTGELYDTGDYGEEWWNLKCACGYEFKIRLEDFPGKAVMRNCMREECPHTPKNVVKESRGEPVPLGRPPLEKRGRARNLYASDELWEGVKALVKENPRELRSVSSAIDFFVSKGIEQWKANKKDEAHGR